MPLGLNARASSISQPASGAHTNRAAIGALGILRLDDALVARIESGQGLPAVIRRALGSIALGGAAYGAVFGLWRAPEAALGSALKLPIVMLGVALVTTLASSLLAPVLRSRLTPARAAVVALVSFATTATVLGSVAPAAALLVLMLPPAPPGALGLETGPLVAPSLAIAQNLVLVHTAAIALAGIAGVLRLVTLLERLGDSPRIARRVVLAWLTSQLLVGGELSWRLRPFLGSPTAPVRFLSSDAFEGSFFEEIARLGVARFGSAAPLVLGLATALVAVWLYTALRDRPDGAVLKVEAAGLVVELPGAAAELLGWLSIKNARAVASTVRVTLAPDAALTTRTIVATCSGTAAALALADQIERTRTSADLGPFRAPAT